MGFFRTYVGIESKQEIEQKHAEIGFLHFVFPIPSLYPAYFLPTPALYQADSCAYLKSNLIPMATNSERASFAVYLSRTLSAACLQLRNQDE